MNNLKMQREHAYCKICNKELTWNGEKQEFEFNCNCYENKSRKRILLWCEECQDFTSRQGVKKYGKCMSCAAKKQHKLMRENDPEGYAKRQSNASKKAHKIMKENNKGIYNKEVRKKIEKTKNENGFYDKLHEASKKWKKENPEKVKEIVTKGAIAANEKRKNEFTDEDWKNWVNKSCNSPTANKNPKSKKENTGYKLCNICNEITFHLNNCCTKCHPSTGTGRHISLEKARKMRSLVKNPFNLNLLKDYSYDVNCNEKCIIYNNCSFKKETLKNKWGWYQKSPNIRNSNFIYKDVIYYKNEPVYQIIQKLESGEYNLKDFPGWNKRWCENCGKYEYHYETKCLICYTANKLSNSNFTEKNDIKYYKNEPVVDIVSKILSGEYKINDFPGFNLRFGHICYGTEDIVTGEHYYLSGSNFQLVEGVEFILNPVTGQYEPSEKFYRRYQDKINSVNPSKEVQNLIDNEGFTLEPIITTGPDSWSRSRTDKYLSDKGYDWIVYVKLLNGHPWIVGKTGTKLVSKSPIDFDFTITDQRNLDNPDYAGPRREYARRYCPEKIYSDFDYVLCKNFSCEQDALIFEEFISQEYCLFTS